MVVWLGVDRITVGDPRKERVVKQLMAVGVMAGALAVTGGLVAPPATATAPTVPTALTVPTTPTAVARYTPPLPADFSQLTWHRAFRELVGKMQAEYAFTQWKDIDFAVLRQVYRPLIKDAWRRDSRRDYYLTLRSFLHEFRDGHVSLRPDDNAVLRRWAGGGFGMTVAPLDDGTVATTWIKPKGAARRAGIKTRARILRWDDVPIKWAMRQVDTRLSPAMPTDWRVRWERSRFLVRAPIGERRTVTFRNRGSDHPRTVVLKAHKDHLVTLDRTSLASVLAKGEWPERMIDFRVLDSGYGYIRIYAEMDMPVEMPGVHKPTLRLWRKAIRELQGTPGLIVDVRGNSGGSDEMVAHFMSSLTRKKRFYEYQNYRVPGTDEFQIWRPDETTGTFRRYGEGVPIRPRKPRYRAPVVAVVDNATISSGEGVAMGIAMLARRGRVVGFSGTNGSFGMAGAGALMPEGFEVHWPYGQSLDHERIVQVDSRDGMGGVMPDHRVHMTARNAARYAHGHDVLVEHAEHVLTTMTARG